MLPDQGSGGSVQRSRNMSTSAGDGEQMQETEPQIQQPAQEENKAHNGRKGSLAAQESPRRCESASRATDDRPQAHALSRSPSSSAFMPSSSTPVPTPGIESRPTSSQDIPDAQLCQQEPEHPEPPVTRATLSELDVSKIIHNTKLRHDINFDPELHFRPNLDGDRGARKQARADNFWNALLGELTEFVADRDSFLAKHGYDDDWCLPTLLKTAKDIIQTLVPQRDRQFLDEGLNVELLMQQFNHGVADLEKLALWLSRVLKSHCAPMRDDLVDTMYELLSRGNREGDLETLIDGMRTLLSVLEAMKLDVANHQIRCLRPVLVEDTTQFEQKYFVKRIESGRTDLIQAREWYGAAVQSYSGLGSTSHSLGEATVFFDAISRFVLPSAAHQPIPDTFTLDEDRIVKLRADMLDMINLDICMRTYETMERTARYHATQEDSIFVANTGMEDFDFNTPPSHSRPSSLVLSTGGSAHSSPRSSLVIPAYVEQDHVDAQTKRRELYRSLVSLLQAETGPASRNGERWRELAPSIALQIIRYTPGIPPHQMAECEQSLLDSLSGTWSSMYKQVERLFHGRLMDALAKRVRDYKQMSGIELFSAAAANRSSVLSQAAAAGVDRDGDPRVRDIEDVAIRVAHFGILHWRVWAEMAYLGDVAAAAAAWNARPHI